MQKKTTTNKEGVAVMATGNAKQNLVNQLGSDNADAIEAFVDERIEQELREHSERFEEVRREVVELREQVGDVPDLRARVNAAAAALRGDIQEHNTRIERHNGGQQVASDELVREEQQLSETREVIDDVRGEHEARLRNIEAILAVNHEGDRPASRLDAIETRLSGVESSLEGANTVAARALSLAQASVRALNSARLALTVGLAVFLVTLVILLMLRSIGVIRGEVVHIFGWSFALGGLATLLVGLFMRQRAEERRANAAAQAEVENSNRPPSNDSRSEDAGIDIVRSEQSVEDRRGEHSVWDEPRSDASASASARAR